MSEKLGVYLTGYIQGRVGEFKTYLLSALDNRDQCLCYLESNEGMIAPISDMKNCELLRDAQIFTEDTKVSNENGRTYFRFFHLTELGRKFAMELKQESMFDDENLRFDNPHEE
jgi:hypothetical protein